MGHHPVEPKVSSLLLPHPPCLAVEKSRCLLGEITIFLLCRSPIFSGHLRTVPPSDVCWFIHPMNTIVISAINHSEIGVMFTNLAIPNWGTTLLYYVQVQYFLVISWLTILPIFPNMKMMY